MPPITSSPITHRLGFPPLPQNIVSGSETTYDATIGDSIEKSSMKAADLLLRGVRMHEVSAVVILTVCLICTAILVACVGFYCVLHCWRHHKESLTAAHRRALVQTSIVSTAIDDLMPPASANSRRSTFGPFSFFGSRNPSRRPSRSSARTVRGIYTEDLGESALLNGKLPQIRISFSGATGHKSSVSDGYRSRLSTTSSILPPWMEGRNSLVHTPQTPGSPISFGSFGGMEPLLGVDRPAPTSFWQRISGAGRCHGHGDSTGALMRLNVENGYDDREIDNRSVLHYELGSYEKTKTSCFCGTLTFSLRYDFIHRVLMLHVLRANHLFGQDRAAAPHPYVKMYLLPERRNHCKTRMIKKSGDPEFNEMFSFDVSYNNLANRMLQFTVYDFDRFTRHGLIGNVIMRDLFDKSDLLQWTEYTMQIVGSQEKNDFGDLLLYLAYSVSNQKLFITVAKAYNLRPMDITGASDPYVRCEQIYQRRRIKLRKTSIKRANLNPVYHECLEFDLAPDQIDETNILIQVMDWDRIGRDDLLGCCVLGKESPTKEGRQQWEQVFSSVRGASTPGDPIPPASPGIDAEDEPPANTNLPRAVGQWHSILGEVPDGFRNIPKATKKQCPHHHHQNGKTHSAKR
uniref:C2 domain-containing protein n=1 Tax=Panagrellus redivivus TaxID=6233 RepID=A0A7E4VHD6_PANRE